MSAMISTKNTHNFRPKLQPQMPTAAAQATKTTISATKRGISSGSRTTKTTAQMTTTSSATPTTAAGAPAHSNKTTPSTIALERISAPPANALAADLARTPTATGSNRLTPFICGMYTTPSMPASKTLLSSTWCMLIVAILQIIVLLSQTPAIQARSTTTVTSTEQQVQNLSEAHTALPLVAARPRLAMESNAIHRLIDGGDDHGRSLKRVFLSNRTVTCNDGSQAGFYLRKNPNSKKWIVFLEGGWHCYDIRSCKARWLRLRHLMTSAQWPETRDVGGILSPLADENPYWHNANHVLVPYCSSDSWSGTRSTPHSRDNNWRFMGALILRQVIADLIPLGLDRQASGGAELLLVGSSAGGLGVMLNLDRITDFLVKERNLLVTVRGVSDSGWFLDREPYTPAAVASSDAVRQGWKLWEGLLPEECVKEHLDEPWRCFFGYRLYPTLKSPLFVFQWLFDEAQMRADNVGAPVTPQQWNYIHEMGGALRSSLDNVTGVFAPSCIGHAVLSKRDWVNIKIDDISLPAALRCWEHSTRPRRKRHDKLKRSTEATMLLGSQMQQQDRQLEDHEQRRQHRLNNQKQQQKHRHAGSRVGNGPHPQRQRLTPSEREERQRRRLENQQRRRENHHRRRNHQRNRKNKRKNGAPPAVSAAADERDADNDSSNNNNNNNGDRKAESNLTSAHPLSEEAVRERRRQNRNRNRKHNNNRNKKNGNNNNNGGHDAPAHQRHEHHRLQHQQDEQQQRHNETDGGGAHAQEPLAGADSDGGDAQKKRSSNSAQQQHKQQQRRNRVPRVPEKCVLRLLERCSWPQCNHSCPTLTNPLTGEEMRFLELLTSFGLDMDAVAAALGVDMHTLNNMDRTELVNLLTQQVS